MRIGGHKRRSARKIARRMGKQPSRGALRARRLASDAPIDTRVVDLSAWNHLKGQA